MDEQNSIAYTILNIKIITCPLLKKNIFKFGYIIFYFPN